MGMTILIKTKPGSQQKVRVALHQLGFENVQIISGPCDIIAATDGEFVGTEAELSVEVSTIPGVIEIVFAPSCTA